MEYADTLVEDQNSLFEQLHAAELELRAKKDEVKVAEAAADEQADLAAQQLVTVQDLKDEADEAAYDAVLAQDPVTPPWRRARRRSTRPSGPRPRTRLEELAKLKKQEERSSSRSSPRRPRTTAPASSAPTTAS